MGTFAGLFRGGRIPDDKRAEFSERVELLFHAGGMMEREYIQMYGKTLVTIKKASMGG